MLTAGSVPALRAVSALPSVMLTLTPPPAVLTTEVPVAATETLIPETGSDSASEMAMAVAWATIRAVVASTWPDRALTRMRPAASSVEPGETFNVTWSNYNQCPSGTSVTGYRVTVAGEGATVTSTNPSTSTTAMYAPYG